MKDIANSTSELPSQVVQLSLNQHSRFLPGKRRVGVERQTESAKREEECPPVACPEGLRNVNYHREAKDKAECYANSVGWSVAVDGRVLRAVSVTENLVVILEHCQILLPC